jgi:hypothetical protein
MRKVNVQISMSLDGFVAPASGAPDHRAMSEDPALKKIKLDWLREVGTHAIDASPTTRWRLTGRVQPMTTRPR